MVQTLRLSASGISARYVNPRIRGIPESARHVKNDISICENHNGIGAGHAFEGKRMFWSKTGSNICYRRTLRKITSMRVPLAGHLLLIASALLVPAQAQTATWLDVADEPHHQLLFQNQDARVFLLELPRLASTQSHCHSHPYLYIVAGPRAGVRTRLTATP